MTAVADQHDQQHDQGAGVAQPRTGWGRVEPVMRSVVLNVAAVLGAICIVLVVLALVFHITLIMFKTGSMSPTIPTGSLAVVKQIPASEAHIGDVVTVDRPGELPITHRVVSVRPAADGMTRLVLKGDANTADDPAPYLVKTVRIVLWSMPGLAYFVVWLSDPFVLGGLTLGVAALVVWVLWPRGTAAGEANRPQHGRRKAV